jgi:hypothetical protein
MCTEIGQLGESSGWRRLGLLSRRGRAGFGVSVFHGPEEEIVIAFQCTSPKPAFDGVIMSDTAKREMHHAQVRQAIEAMAEVMAAHPKATLRLTGHSLGGGLASLMAVFFDLDATVFAPAPFESFAKGSAVVQYFSDYVSYQGVNSRTTAINAQFQAYASLMPAAQHELFLQRQRRVNSCHFNRVVSRS